MNYLTDSDKEFIEHATFEELRRERLDAERRGDKFYEIALAKAILARMPKVE